MKNRRLKFIFSLILFGLLGVISFRLVFFSYQSNVNHYKRIEVTNVKKVPTDSIIYIGRKSCPSCTEFVPKFSDAVKQSGIKKRTVYYLDTDKEKKRIPGVFINLLPRKI